MRLMIMMAVLIMLYVPEVLHAEELHLLLDTSTQSWYDRDPVSEPAGEHERLALQSAAAGTLLTQGRLKAYCRECGGAEVVITVEEMPENVSDGYVVVTKYRVAGGRITGNSWPAYVVKPSAENEQVAREIALSYQHGRVSTVPVVYNGLVYVAEPGGTCQVNVTAKSDMAVDFVYRFRTCK